MLNRHAQIGLMGLLGAVALVRAQNAPPQQPPPSPAGVSAPSPTTGRGAQAAPLRAAAVIRGVVVAADTGVPIKRAQVRVTNVSGGRGGALIGTNDQGGYELSGLPPGTYQVNVSKTGYVALSFGQRAPAEAPKPIELAAGQVASGINFQLPRGSVIAATIVDANGEPFTAVRVDALQYRLLDGQRRLVSIVSGAETNDLGQVRIFGLFPGDYLVKSTAPINVAAADKNLTYVPTFYPGTVVANEARRVTLGVNQESQVTFALAAVRLAKVSGSIRRADGTPIVSPRPGLGPPQPPGVSRFNISLRKDDGSFLRVNYNISTDAAGNFVVNNVEPGSYVLEVRPPASINGPAFSTTPDGRPPDGLASAEFARVPVDVVGQDIDHLDITTSPGATLSGQLIFDTGRTPADKTPSELGVIVYYTGSEPALASGATVMKNDFSFTISGVVATGILRLQSTTTGWYTKSVVIDGRELVQTPIVFEPGRSYKNIQLTLTQKRSEVNGRVVDGRGAAVPDYTVVLFPEDRDWWYPRSRIILTARPDQNGQFKIPTLPDGSYYVVALPFLEQGADQDAETLATIAPRATKLTLSEGEAKTIELRLQELR